MWGGSGWDAAAALPEAGPRPALLVLGDRLKPPSSGEPSSGKPPPPPLLQLVPGREAFSRENRLSGDNARRFPRLFEPTVAGREPDLNTGGLPRRSSLPPDVEGRDSATRSRKDPPSDALREPRPRGDREPFGLTPPSDPRTGVPGREPPGE